MKRALIILLILSQFMFAANYSSMGQVKKMVAADLRMTDYGSSLGANMQWRLFNNFHVGVNAGWTFVSSGKEYTWTDPYTGYTMRINTIHLDFIKAGVYLKKHFFTNQLANTFAPFISLQAGPVLAIDTDNDPWANISRYQDASYYLGFYSNFHLGIDFMMERHSALTIALGYEINQFNQPVDEVFSKPNWNGAAIVLNYGRYF